MALTTTPEADRDEPPVAFHEDGPICEIRLRRPHKRNAITPEMARLCDDALFRLESSSEVRVGVISSEGPVFCAGADLGVIASGEGHLLSTKTGGFAGIARYPRRKPLIAAVQGAALAGGFEVALACDLIVAEKTAKFGLPEVSRGIIANGGGLLRLSALLPPALALDLILTGRAIDAPEAASFGIVSRVVDVGTARQRALELANQIADLSPEAVQTSLHIARVSAYTIPESMWDLCSALATSLRTSPDAVARALAFVEHRESVSDGGGEGVKSEQ